MKPDIEKALPVRVTDDLLAAVALLERECFSLPWSEQSLALFVGESGVAFAIELDGKVVAYGGMLTVLDEGQIQNIAVSLPYRRRGLGRMIMDALEKHARQNGIVQLSLEVRESNTAARALYASCGWSEVGIRKNFYSAPRESAVVMIKNLEQTGK